MAGLRSSGSRGPPLGWAGLPSVCTDRAADQKKNGAATKCSGATPFRATGPLRAGQQFELLRSSCRRPLRAAGIGSACGGGRSRWPRVFSVLCHQSSQHQPSRDRRSAAAAAPLSGCGLVLIMQAQPPADERASERGQQQQQQRPQLMKPASAPAESGGPSLRFALQRRQPALCGLLCCADEDGARGAEHYIVYGVRST